MAEKGMKGRESVVGHLLAASRYSRDGLVAAITEEVAVRLILLECCVLGPLAVVLGQSWSERVLLCLPLVFCVLVELLNTAIENAVDRISLVQHPLAKKAKDMGSAAQACAQAFLCLVWLSYVLG